MTSLLDSAIRILAQSGDSDCGGGCCVDGGCVVSMIPGSHSARSKQLEKNGFSGAWVMKFVLLMMRVRSAVTWGSRCKRRLITGSLRSPQGISCYWVVVIMREEQKNTNPNQCSYASWVQWDMLCSSAWRTSVPKFSSPSTHCLAGKREGAA